MGSSFVITEDNCNFKMALNLVSYDASDNESDMEEMAEPSNADRFSQPSEESDIPKPSEKELKLAELAKREKANLFKSEALMHMSKKKNGRIVIGIPSMADLEEDSEEKKLKKPTSLGTKGQSKLFAKLPPPRNSRYEPLEKRVEVTEKPSFLKKSNPLITQSVIKKQTQINDSDDEESGSFFTLDEPALKEPIILAEPEFRTTHSTNKLMETAPDFTPMPTNQQYNLANISNEMPSEPVPMELDDEALQALQGTKRKLPDDAEIIEVRAERLTYDPSNSYLNRYHKKDQVLTVRHLTSLTINCKRESTKSLIWPLRPKPAKWI